MVVGDNRGFTRGNGESTTVDIGIALRRLSNPICREIVRQLVLAPSNTAELDRLMHACAEYVEKEKKTVEIAFQHVHLPALEDAGFIEYDEQSGDVRYFRDPFIDEVMEVVGRWEN